MKDFMSYFSAKPVLGNGARITVATGTLNDDGTGGVGGINKSTAVDVTSLNGGNDGLCFVVAVGAIDGTNGGSHVFSLEDSIDGGSTYQAVASPYIQTPSAQVLGSSTSPVTNASTPAGTVLKFGYLGNPNIKTIANSTSPIASGKVLVKLVDTVSIASGGNGTAGAYITGIAILGYPQNEPAV